MDIKYYPLYWIRSANFGDALNEDIYKLITGRDPEWSDKSSKIVAAGSILHAVKPYDIVWGTGAMSEDFPIQADKTTEILAVRGPLTAKLLRDNGLEVPHIYFDPASALPLFYKPKPAKKVKIGIVAHYADIEKVEEMALPAECEIIKDLDRLKMVDKIASCEYIISSSLHGLVVAEAYGIPALWVEFSDNVGGKGFKFRDYYSGLGMDISPLNFRNGIDLDKCEFKKKLIVSIDSITCPFNWKFDQWKSDPSEWVDWSDRNKIVAKFIRSYESVIEFGAGNGSLKKYLPESCNYLPTDKVERDGMLKIDLNGNDPIVPGYDVAVFSGVLEYIHRLEYVFRNIYGAGIRNIVLSYYPMNNFQTIEWRRYNGWVNELEEVELLLLLGKLGYYPIRRRQWNGQVIYRMGHD